MFGWASAGCNARGGCLGDVVRSDNGRGVRLVPLHARGAVSRIRMTLIPRDVAEPGLLVVTRKLHTEFIVTQRRAAVGFRNLQGSDISPDDTNRTCLLDPMTIGVLILLFRRAIPAVRGSRWR